MSSRRVTTYRALASASRVTLLDALRRRDGLTVAELAEVAGIHPNTAREHLGRLIEAGFVTSSLEERHTRGRPRMLYHAVPGPDETTQAPETAPDRRDALAREELLRLVVQGFGTGSPADAERARDLGREASRRTSSVLGAPLHGPRLDDGCTSLGRPAGSARAQLALLAEHLEETGFEPVTTDDPLRVETHECPFFDLAREHPDVVCRMHEGLLEGVLARAHGPYELDSISTFSGPGRCVVQLRRRDEAPSVHSSLRPVLTTFPGRAASRRTELPTPPA